MLLWHLVANLSKETLHRVYSINIGTGRTFYHVVGLFTAGKYLLKWVLLEPTGCLLDAINFLSRIDESETWKQPRARKVQVVLEVLFQAALELFFFFCIDDLAVVSDWRSAVEGEGAPFCPPMQTAWHHPPTNKPLPLLSDFMAIRREGTPPTHAHCLSTLERVYPG